MEKDFLRGKTVLVMGLGRFEGGVDSAIFAYNSGARVIVTDLSAKDRLGDSLKQLNGCEGIEYHLGRHLEDDFNSSSPADVVIVNPAIPPDNSFILMAKQSGKIITSQIELLFRLCPAGIVGITGANGKSTTTALTAHLLEAGIGQRGFGHKHVWLGGNIGNRPLLSKIGQIEPDDIVVLEISSFQLEQLSCISRAPDVSVITNITPNHLDRHGTFENYCSAKDIIFRYQKLDPADPCVSIFNAEDDITMRWYNKYKDQPGRRCILFCTDDIPAGLVEKFRLAGRANRSNLSAALKVARHFGIEQNRLEEATGSFVSLPHRLELVETIKGVGWYNDSIATTPVSTIVALEAFECPKILIAGGYDKGVPFDQMGQKIVERAKAVLLIGKTAHKIAAAIDAAGRGSLRVETAQSLDQAVEKASALAQPGDVVLLSPACASYDMFDNFRQRGEIFCRLVRCLPR